MRRQTYLVRKGARYHFRRRIGQLGINHPITIALNTSDPDEARLLARRLAVRWDETEMGMVRQIERGTLTLNEIGTLMRQGMEEELAHATRHLTAPMGAGLSVPNGYHKILEAAFRIVARVPDDTEFVDEAIMAAELDDSWTEQEARLLRTTLKLYVTPMYVSRVRARSALDQFECPVNDGTIGEARSQLLRGHAEAHRRAGLLDTREVQRSGRGVMALVDDTIVGRALLEERGEPETCTVSNPSSSATAFSHPESIYAKPSDAKFSEVIRPLLEKMKKERGWKNDHGQRRSACERAAWICGDKPLCDWSAHDAEYFAEMLARFPTNYKWGRLNESGNMATPFDEGRIPPVKPGKERKPRTINRDLSILQTISARLSKTHWKLKYGGGIEVDFGEYMIKVEDDPDNPDRMPWTPAHLRTLYGLPLWRGGGGSLARLKTSGSLKVWMDAAYWVAIIGTYTGANREEICGLEVDDFNFECEVPYLVIKKNDLRGLKTLNRNRVMPLHPELLRLSLQGYIIAVSTENIEVKGGKPAFPELYDHSAKKSAEGKKAPKIGGRQFHSIAWCFIVDATHAVMALPETRDGKKADFHSQRTYNQSVLASPDMAQTIIDRHMGHASEGTGPKSYNRRKLALGEALELKERLTIMMREMPDVTSHVPRQEKPNLLALNKRSRVGSVPGRNA